MGKFKPNISVIVCTFNRAGLLKSCLESLANQSLKLTDYEVVVVDNNSSDNTQEITNDFARQFSNFRVIKEKRQGKSYALNTGIAVSQGKYIAFIDDDAKAYSDWLERILDAFKSVTPKPVSVGGTIYPWYEQPPPEWFTDDLEIRSWGTEKCFLQPPRAQWGFSGSNMAFPQKILKKYGGFSIDFGPVGENFALGEETALSSRIYQDLPWYWYDPDIRVKHWVPVEKMSVSNRLKRAYLAGIATYGIRGDDSTLSVIRLLVVVFLKSTILPLRVNWWKKGWQTNYLKYAQPIASGIGTLKAIISPINSKKQSK